MAISAGEIRMSFFRTNQNFAGFNQSVHVLSSEGKLLDSINTGLPLTSNLSFIDKDSLLFTGGFKETGPGGLYKIIL